MPQFQPKRQEQILADEIASLVTNTLLSDVADSSSVKGMLSATAREIDESYFQMENVLSLFDIDKATGDDLDERAKEIQPGTITRVGPRSAVGTVVFSRAGTTGTVNIPTGTRVKTGDGLIFTTTAVGTITPTSPEQIGSHGIGRDSAPVPIVAEAPGSAGNVVSSTIIKFDTKPAGVDEVTNLSPTTLGRDKQSDDAFRQRLKDFIASLSRCTPLALENGVLGAEDETTGASILFSKAVEDIVNLGKVTLFIDDGTGAAESTAAIAATALVATYTWSGPSLTVTTGGTSEVAVGDFVGLTSDTQLFEIASIVPNVSVTVLNPGSLTVPSGATPSRLATSMDRLTQGLAGPPADTAVGGETTLLLDNKPLKTTIAISLVSSTRGVLVENTDYTVNPASGQIDFTPALVATEVIFAEYTYFTGLIALGQKIVDGDPNDRDNFPGLRAAGVLVRVLTPQVLIQTVTASLVVREGFSQTQTITDAEDAVKSYINGLGISDDVVRNEIISRIQSITAVSDLVLSAPANNIILLDDQLARITDPNINIT